MINIRIVYPKDNTFPETFVYCSKCSNKTLFYSVSPRKCTHCSNIFPDIRALKLSSDYRVDWHKDLKNA